MHMLSSRIRRTIHTPYTNGTQPLYVSAPPVHIIRELVESQIDVRPSALWEQPWRGTNVDEPETR